MIMKPSFEFGKFRNSKSRLDAKKLGYFKVSAGFRVALPSHGPAFPRGVQKRLNRSFTPWPMLAKALVAAGADRRSAKIG